MNLSEIHIIVILSSEIKVQDMPMEGDFMGDQDMPQPPQDNNQVKKNTFSILKTVLRFRQISKLVSEELNGICF